MGFTETYQSAISRCASLNGTILSTIEYIDSLEEGKEYWANIYRSKILKWITNESFYEVCNEVEGWLDIDCLYLKVIYRKVYYIPSPCKNKKKAICIQPGDPDVISHWQISKEINTTPNTKVEISTDESKFTPPQTLRSSNVSTEVTQFSASTMTSKSTIALASSMPSKSTIHLASLIQSMSTNIGSTNLDYTKSSNGCSTKEHHYSVATTFIFVLVCLQASMIAILRRHGRKTQEGNQYELTSQLTNEPRIYAQPEIQHYEVVDDNPV